jgi:hypothetical protein
MTTDRQAVQTSEEALTLLGACDYFHDWFPLEVRGLSPIRFAETGVVYPPGGHSLAVRLANGRREVTLVLEDVSRFVMGSGADAIQDAEVTIDVRGEVTVRLDHTVVVARSLSWSEAAYNPAMKLGPAVPTLTRVAAVNLGEGWTQCPACSEAWQPHWQVEPCPGCGVVLTGITSAAREIRRTTGEGTGVSSGDLASIDTSEVDWHRADLSGLALDGVSFEGASMRNAELRGVQAANATFSRANVIMASFRGAVLLDADFTEARCRHTDFSGAVLRNVTFAGADLTNAKFLGADVEGADFTGALVVGADFEGSNATEAQLASADQRATGDP